MHTLQLILRRVPRATVGRSSPLLTGSTFIARLASVSTDAPSRPFSASPASANSAPATRTQPKRAEESAPSETSAPTSSLSGASESPAGETGSDGRTGLGRTASFAATAALRIPDQKHAQKVEEAEAMKERHRLRRRQKAARAVDFTVERVSKKAAAASVPSMGRSGASRASTEKLKSGRRPGASSAVSDTLDQIATLKQRLRKLQSSIKPWDELTSAQRYRQIHFARRAASRAEGTRTPADAASSVQEQELEQSVAKDWPQVLSKLRNNEKTLQRELSQARKALAELRALPVPIKGLMPKRHEPPLMDRIAQTLPLTGDASAPSATAEDNLGESATNDAHVQSRRTGRIKPLERRHIRASATSARAGRYTDHPALQEMDATTSEPREVRELSSYQHVLSASSIPYDPRPSPLGDVPVATLAHSLDRVLFNPGVHFLRDPRTGVYNFARDLLENVPKVDEFDFSKLPQYITSSQDETLRGLLETEGRTFAGSTSSTIGMLCQIYFWLSKGKPINTGMLSSDFRESPKDFSMGQQLPASVVLKHSDGRYSIDADKSFDVGIETNILAHYGHLMEKLLTTDAKEFKRFLLDSEDPAPSEADHRQAYHYGMTKHLVLRSQLDAHNQYLPNKTFDLKTRGTVAIRQDRLNYEESAGYIIDKLRGPWESFEREYYDLIRSAFLKYQFQARIGCMDGIFVAYHSTARFYGFQYVPISEMDDALFDNSATGDAVFRLALGSLETILLRAKDCFPGESVNATFAVDHEQDVLRVFVARQADLEKLEQASPITEGEKSPTTTEGAEATSTDSPAGDSSVETTTSTEESLRHAIPMTLLEVRGTSYLDGEAQHEPVTLPNDAYSSASVAPESRNHRSEEHFGDVRRKNWQIAFDITASSTTSPPQQDAVPPAQIARLFARTREHQRMFSNLYLPTGVSPAEVREAQRRAQEVGVELDESDLALRFPVADGLEYTNPSRGVKALRKRAREGEERRKVEQEKRRGEKVIEVQSRVVERAEVFE